MNLTKLRYFHSACQYLNISRAAEALHLSQSSVSGAVKDLEEEYGLPLIHRQKTGFSLTPDGEALLKLAESLLEHADRVDEIMYDRGKKQRLIRLGMPPMAGCVLFPMIYGKFCPAHPEIGLTTREAGRKELLRQLDDGLLDLAFLPHAEMLPPDYETMPVLLMETACCLSVHHPLADRASIRPSDLADQPLVLFTEEFFQNELISRLFSEAGLAPRIVHKSSQLSTVEQLIADRIAVGFLFRQLTERLPEVCAVSLDPPILTGISLVWKNSRHLHSDVRQLIRYFSSLTTISQKSALSLYKQENEAYNTY